MNVIEFYESTDLVRYTPVHGGDDFFTVLAGNEALWDAESIRSWTVGFGNVDVRLPLGTERAECMVKGTRFLVKRCRGALPPHAGIKVGWEHLPPKVAKVPEAPPKVRRKGYETPQVLRARLVRDHGEDFVTELLARSRQNKEFARQADVTSSCICAWRKRLNAAD